MKTGSRQASGIRCSRCSRLWGKFSSNIRISRISSVSRSRSLIFFPSVMNSSSIVRFAAYSVMQRSAMDLRILSNPSFCSSHWSIFLSASKIYPSCPLAKELFSSNCSSLALLRGVMFPPLTNDICPVSSETTMTSASVSSEIPMAALCLMP